MFEEGKIVEGKVSGITNFGAFVQLPDGKVGLVHISEIAEEYVKDVRGHLKEDQVVKVKVISIDDKGKINLSIKKALENSNSEKNRKPAENEWSRNSGNSKTSFEDLLAKFMKDSDEKLGDLKKSLESKRGSGYRRY